MNDAKTMADVEVAAMDYCDYEDACNAAGVSTYCEHGIRWNRCTDGCRVVRHGGRLHFEIKVAPAKYVCSGHSLAIELNGGGK